MGSFTNHLVRKIWRSCPPNHILHANRCGRKYKKRSHYCWPVQRLTITMHRILLPFFIQVSGSSKMRMMVLGILA